MNAYQLAMDRSDLVYVEGYAAGVIPVQHAWCVTTDGKVVDPTWKDGSAYIGVPLNGDYVRKYALKTGHYGILCDWLNHWPITVAPKAEWEHPSWVAKVV